MHVEVFDFVENTILIKSEIRDILFIRKRKGKIKFSGGGEGKQRSAKIIRKRSVPQPVPQETREAVIRGQNSFLKYDVGHHESIRISHLL